VKKKAFMTVLPLFVIAIAAVPAVAQAEPHWYTEGTRLKEAEAVSVAVSGELTLGVQESGKAEYKSKCKLTATDSISNPTGGAAGTDEFTAMTFTACKETPVGASPCAFGAKIEETVAGLPDVSKLTLVGKKLITDSITVKPSVEIKCSGTVVKTFSGTLTPKVSAKLGNGVLQWGKIGAGELTNGTAKAKPLGAATLTGPAGKAKVTVHNP
jgi:hypothetical protein